MSSKREACPLKERRARKKRGVFAKREACPLKERRVTLKERRAR